MLKNTQIIFQIQRKSMRNVYIDTSEMLDALENLTKGELKLFIILYNSPLIKPTIEYFDISNLAKLTKCSEGALRNNLTGLKSKEYALIERFKDNRNNPMVKVIVGRSQVELYKLGLDVEITNAKHFKKLERMFDITNKTLTLDQRKQTILEANKYVLNNPEEFK